MKNNIKTLPIFFIAFPIIAIVLQIIAIIIGTMGITDDENIRIILGTWLSIANGLVIISIIFALVGAIKRTKSMYIIGSGVSLAVGTGAIVTVFVVTCVACAANKTNGYLVALLVATFILAGIISLLLIIASLVTGGRKKASYAFLGATSVICLLLFGTFTVVTALVYKVNDPIQRTAMTYALTNNIAFIVLLISLVILSFIRHPENEIEDEIPSPTIIIANPEVTEATKKYLDDAAKAQGYIEEEKKIESLADANPTSATNDSTQTDSLEELRKYKKMLDEGLITEQDYEKKKAEILK